MILKNYGLELVRLRPDHIEMVRQWRNATQISSQMEYRHHITHEMQVNWFHSIDNLSNFYFVIKFGSEFLGLIHLSNIDRQKRKGSAGLFISHPDYLATTIPVRASLAILDFGFGNLDLKRVLAKVKKDNTKALTYNKKLGFQYFKDSENPQFAWLELTKSYYLEKTQRLRSQASLLYGNEEQLTWDPSFPVDNKIRDLLSSPE